MRIIILTTFEADEYVFEAIRAGASPAIRDGLQGRGGCSCPM